VGKSSVPVGVEIDARTNEFPWRGMGASQFVLAPIWSAWRSGAQQEFSSTLYTRKINHRCT